MAAGGTVESTIRLRNTGTEDAVGVSIVDRLPAGFRYQAGSASGATTADPLVDGHRLTWPGPFSVPAGGTLTVSFGATASGPPGTYFNDVEAGGANLLPVQTGDTAPVTVQVLPTSTPTRPATPAPSPHRGAGERGRGGDQIRNPKSEIPILGHPDLHPVGRRRHRGPIRFIL